ncbi:uncharacterized protein PFL1_06251 [Pseudozyma flocculosa PF-1]|uniref:Zn(2)-C6 fungal-type domain-containing protein n=2 Tax=Pseudozyma flocculosa TaxID=84751 RepID=A0A5C3F966_9BASI|nr:uncharacterized protein PFL1_06251 [Pseudozyma flocculosa PF-1]EPQ26316.1 hypothetical protein PFL1_06251 [Pseudozyma flocculosa PF-1]SPO40277.1 uncharacterized protein PSFLO_05759 [Pseudozyma flocculosa]
MTSVESSIQHGPGPGPAAAAAAAGPAPNTPASADTTPSRGPPRKRNRQALSCSACRERKIKCDRIVPCSQCVKRGDQEHCHIEQKPKLEHPKPSRTKNHDQRQQNHQQQAASSTASGQAASASSSYAFDDNANGNGPPSPGTLAYNQFSAALSTNGSVYSSISPPPAEVDAIKARLALLESVMGKTSPASMSNLALAALDPASASSPDSSSHHASSASWLPRGSTGSSPIDNFAGAPRSDSTRSTSLGAHSHSPSSQQRTESDSEEEPDWMSLRSSDAHRDSSKESQGVAFGPRYHDSIRDIHKMSRKELDSDTEEAVTVLETLAMNNGQQQGNGTSCPASAAEADRHEQECEEVRVGFERCLLRDKQHDIMADDGGCPNGGNAAGPSQAGVELQDLIATAAAAASAPAQPSVVPPDGGMDPSLLSIAVGDRRSGVPGATARGVGGPQCACGPNCAPGKDGAHAADGGEGPIDTCGPPGPKSEFLKKACAAACSNVGVLRPKNGPETLLGWGLGWAFAAGDARLQADRQQAKDEGRAFVISERTEREYVLRVIIEALPSKEVVNQLVEVYESRVRYLCGHIIHIPCLRREIEAFYALESVEKRARVVNHVDAGWLAMLLSVLALALRFYPCQPKEGWVPVNHLFDGGQTVALWHSASKTCLTLAGYLHSTSISVLQSILLNMLLLGGSWVGDSRDTDQIVAQGSLIRVAISNAQEMGLHRLGDLDKQGTREDPPSKVIRREIAKRVWWALISKDWCMAASGSRKDYIIDRDRFNTPMPGNYNDDDLLISPLPAPRPREEFTEMSYVLSNLEFSLAIKEDFDVRNRREMLAASTGGDRRITCAEARALDQRYRSVLENAPHFFRVGSDAVAEGRVTCAEVQRWLLQQGVFSKLLRIHRPTLSSRQESRTNCVLLARSILDMQKKIRSKCTVIDRLWMNLMQSFSAAIVLALHLLHSRPQADHRLAVRSEILEAISALKQIDGGLCANVKCIRVIEALLAEEEERWQAGNAVLASTGRNGAADPMAGMPPHQLSHKRKWQNEPRSAQADEAGGHGRRKNLLSLAQRVAAATMGSGQDTPRPADLVAAAAAADQDDSHKRAATQAAVQGNGGGFTHLSTTAAFAPNPMHMGAFGADASSLPLSAMTLPNPGPSPLPALASSGGGGGGGASGFENFNFQFPVLPYNAQQPHLVYDFSSNSGSQSGGASGAAPWSVDNVRHVSAPNGVDFSLNNPNTPPDGQAFDLAAFLEQCENSPGSSSDGSGMPGDQRSFSFASDTSGHDQSRSASIDGVSSMFGSPAQTSGVKQENAADSLAASSSSNGALDSSPSNSAPLVPANNMDSFWNWVLTQGSAASTALPAATTAGAEMPPPPPPLPQQQQQPAIQQALSSAVGTTSVPASTGLTPFALNDLPLTTAAEASALLSAAPLSSTTDQPSVSAATTMAPASVATMTLAPASAAPTMSTSTAVPFPLYQVGTPSNMDMGNVGDVQAKMLSTPQSGGILSQSPLPYAGTLPGYGTPSADVGVDSFLGAPLYDFTDYALAWTASNPNAAVNTASGQGPISDP